MTPHKHFLHDYKECYLPNCVDVAIDQTTHRLGIGSLKFTTPNDNSIKIIPNVWHVPALRDTLISSNTLKAAKCKVGSGDFPDMSDYVYYNGNLVMKCPLVNGLCRPEVNLILNETSSLSPSPSTSSPPAQSFIIYAKSNHSADVETPALWHQRLGHAGINGIISMMKNKKATGINVPLSKMIAYKPKHCEVCILAKLDKSPFHPRPDPPVLPMDELHSDVSGPWPVKSLGRSEYNLVVLDGATSFNVSHVLTNKYKVSEALKSTIETWENFTGRRLKKLITDRGGEYYSDELKAYLAGKGIVHEFAPRKTPELNGKAENLNKLLGNMTRSMLAQYNLPDTLWAHAVTYASYLCNVMFRNRLGKTPFEAFKNKIPDLSNIRTFGCKCYARLDKTDRNKLTPKSQLGIYLGPEIKGPGYQVLTFDGSKYSVRTFRDIVTFESLTDCCGVQDSARLRWGGSIPLPDQRPVSQRTVASNSGENPTPIPRISLADRLRAPEQLGSAQPQVGTNSTDGTGALPCNEPLDIQEAPSMDNANEDLSLLTGHPPQNNLVDLPQAFAPSGNMPRITLPVNSETPAQSVRIMLQEPRPSSIKRMHAMLSNAQNHKHKVKISNQGVPTFIGESMNLNWDDLDEYDAATVCMALNAAGPLPVVTPHDIANPPKILKEAMLSPLAEFWIVALNAEMTSLLSHNTWTLVPYKRGMKVIPCKWVFVIKTDADGKPIKFKCRLVAGGHRQIQFLDYDETYAPVSRTMTLRVFLSVAAHNKWKVKQLDVTTAFLHGNIDTDVYMRQPDGFVEGENLVCKLDKCLYGLKQAPRAWYHKLSAALTELGFESVGADTSFWMNTKHPSSVYLTSVVDDMLIASPCERQTSSIVEAILAKFPGTHKVLANDYISIKLSWFPLTHSVVLTQAAKVEDMLQKYAPFDTCWNSRTLPISPDLKLCKTGSSAVPMSPPLDVTKYPYRSLVGSLNYLACHTRPDIAFTVNQLAKYSNYPTEEHWNLALSCLKYLKGTKDWGLKLGHSEGECDVQGNTHPAISYCDASHGTGLDDTRSVTGTILLVYGGAIGWMSRTQPLTSASTTESEYRAMSDCSKDSLHLAKILKVFQLEHQPMIIKGDNMGAIHSVKNYTDTRYTKHIEIHHNFMKDRYQWGHLDFQHVPGSVNPADLFTKALGGSKFKQFRAQIGMVSLIQEGTRAGGPAGLEP